MKKYLVLILATTPVLAEPQADLSPPRMNAPYLNRQDDEALYHLKAAACNTYEGGFYGKIDQTIYVAPPKRPRLVCRFPELGR